MHPQKIILIISFFLLTRAGFGQNTPDHEYLLRGWFQSQRAALAPADTIYYGESVKWTIDAPFGSPSLELQSRVRTNPFRARRWTQTGAAFINDRQINESRIEEVKRRWHTNTRRQVSEIVAQTEPRPGLLERMQPAGPVTSDTIDDRPVWRVEVIRKDRRMALERLTFWFASDANRLLRTRAIVSPNPDGPNFVITTDYVERFGFDHPVRRTVEGTVTIKRRSRYFTVLISQEATFDNIQMHRFRNAPD